MFCTNSRNSMHIVCCMLYVGAEYIQRCKVTLITTVDFETHNYFFNQSYLFRNWYYFWTSYFYSVVVVLFLIKSFPGKRILYTNFCLFLFKKLMSSLFCFELSSRQQKWKRYTQHLFQFLSWCIPLPQLYFFLLVLSSHMISLGLKSNNCNDIFILSIPWKHRILLDTTRY